MAEGEPNKLLFIDTNIWLDFYRPRGESTLTLLKHVEGVADRLITTYQVESEFKTNRQAAINEGLSGLKDFTAPSRIGIFSDHPATKELAKLAKEADKHVKELKKQLDGVLTDPEKHDPIYQTFHALFHKSDPLTLKRDNPKKGITRRRALKRFLHNCPPRKKGDVSIGDAFNWEWVVACAKEKNCDLILVSRDGDYGFEHAKKYYLNDHLKQEFAERVGEKRRVSYHRLLSEGLKEMGVDVSIREQQEEVALVKSIESALAKALIKGILSGLSGDRDSLFKIDAGSVKIGPATGG